MARPLRWETKEDAEREIQAFFDLIKEGIEEPSVVGLADYLGVHKQTLLNYQEKDEFADLITLAKQKIEKMFTAKAYGGKIPANIFIFTAKNHYDYSDTQDLNHGGQHNNPIKHEVNVNVNINK